MIYLRAGFSDQINSDYSIFATFKYDEQYVKLIKSLKNRRWNPDTKEWEIGWECYTPLISILNDSNIPYNGNEFLASIRNLKDVIENLKAQKEKDSSLPITYLDDKKFKTQPLSYQKEGILYGLTHPCFLLADDQGLGKSFQSLNIATLKRNGNHCLIICGYDTLQFNWVAQIEEHTNENAHILGQQTKKGNIVTGNLKQRFEDLENLNKIEEFFIITSATTIRQCQKGTEYKASNGKTKTSKIYYMANLIEYWCRREEIGRIIYDEFQTLKNFESQQTQAMLKIKSVPYKIAITGTPLMNRNLDLYPLLTWLGIEKMDYYSFRDRYCKMGGFKHKQIIGNKNSAELHVKLNQCMLRRKKEQVMDLPEKIMIDEWLEMSSTQIALHDKVKRMMQYELAQNKFNKVALLAATLKLRKITCHPAWYDESYEGKEYVKFDRLKQIVSEAVENNQKTILFSNFTTPFLELGLYDYFKQQGLNAAMIIGETKDRMKEVNKFQNDDSCYVIMGSIGAMGTGLTLNKAQNVIFLDEPWNKALKDQAIDRSHRIGTKYPVNVYTLICKDSIDEMVHKIVTKKGRVADEIVDGVTTEELQQIFNI